jgi:DNA-binding response OmpR family regulator
MLTARDSTDDRVLGLDTGADDYIVKPFEFDELFARIRALGRRAMREFQEDKVQLGEMHLNRSSHTLFVHGKDVSLTYKEYQLMESLIMNAKLVLTREQLIQKVWGLDAEVTDNNLDALVKLTRKKLREANAEHEIKSVRNVGYRIK